MQIGHIAAAAANAHPVPNQAEANSSQLADSILYSASAGGKTYTGDVGLAAGQYTAEVPQLPGIAAIGPSMLAAESRLNQRISVLV
jgi:hypothetical protein